MDFGGLLLSSARQLANASATSGTAPRRGAGSGGACCSSAGPPAPAGTPQTFYFLRARVRERGRQAPRGAVIPDDATSERRRRAELGHRVLKRVCVKRS